MNNAKTHHSSDPGIILKGQSWAGHSKQARLQSITEQRQALAPNIGSTSLTTLKQEVPYIKSGRESASAKLHQAE